MKTGEHLAYAVTSVGLVAGLALVQILAPCLWVEIVFAVGLGLVLLGWR